MCVHACLHVCVYACVCDGIFEMVLEETFPGRWLAMPFSYTVMTTNLVVSAKLITSLMLKHECKKCVYNIIF